MFANGEEEMILAERPCHLKKKKSVGKKCTTVKAGVIVDVTEIKSLRDL